MRINTHVQKYGLVDVIRTLAVAADKQAFGHDGSAKEVYRETARALRDLADKTSDNLVKAMETETMATDQKIFACLESSHVWLTIGDVASLTGIDRETVTSILAGYTAQGHVKQAGNTIDGYVYAVLTDQTEDFGDCDCGDSYCDTCNPGHPPIA